MKTTIVYQCYGSPHIFEQTFFSAVSLLKQRKSDQLDVVFYTDDVKKVENFFGSTVKTVLLTTEDLKNYRGQLDFVHRAKIKILQDAAARFAGDLLYLDGDTYFVQSPEQLTAQISEKSSLMHIAETALNQAADPLTKKIGKFVRKNFDLVQIPSTTVMWNAGVIGLAEKNKNWLAEILRLTDVLYTGYQKHVMEQLAVSHVLQKHSQVLPSDSVLVHYWDSKPAHQLAIQKFFAEHTTLGSAIEAYGNFVPPKPEPRRGKESFFSKWF